jgi:hypothetical protein
MNMPKDTVVESTKGMRSFSLIINKLLYLSFINEILV